MPGVARAQDTTPPQLTALSFTPTAINTTSAARTVTLNYTATDDQSGVTYFEASFVDSNGIVYGSTNNSTTAALSVTSSASSLFPQLTPGGTYTLAAVYLMDASGNGVLYNTAALNSAGFNTTLTITSSNDTTAPVLTALSYSSSINTASAAANLTVNFTATDDLSGVKTFQIGFISPSGSTTLMGTATVTPATSVTGSATVSFPQGSEGGTWTVGGIVVNDANGNQLSLNTAAITGLTFPTTLTVTSTPADTTAPVLTALNITPSSITTTSASANVTIGFSATDNQSGVKTFQLSFLSPTGTILQGSVTVTPATSVTNSAIVSFPMQSETGTWTVAGVTLSDAAGNVATYNTAALTGLTFPTTLTVATAADTTPPVLTAFNFTPTSINTSALPRNITVSFSVTDNASGAVSFQASFVGPLGTTVQASAAFAASTSYNNTVTIAIPQGSEGGTWNVASIVISDQAGNQKIYLTSDLTGLSFPTQLLVSAAPQPPTASSQSQSTTYPNATTFALNVSDPNTFALTYHQTVAPANGTVNVTCTTTCSATYTPTVGTGGADSFNYYVSNTIGLNSSTALVSITVNQASQSINFGSLSGQTFGASPFTISATATSGLTVSFASTTTSVCTVSGTTVTIVGAGSCSITASQAGTASYSAATNVIQGFTVAMASQTINFGALSAKNIGDQPFTISATSTSGLTVTFASTTTSVCTVSGTTVTIVAGGACSITASQAGNSNYNAAADVIQGFQVGKLSQTITFGTLSGQTFGVSPFTIGATATSNLTVTFASTTTGVCTVSGTTVTILAAGSCSITASQAGNSGYLAAPDVIQGFTVAKAAQTTNFGTLSGKTYGNAPFTVGATATSSLTVTFASTTTSVCTVSGTTVTIVAAGACSITASQAGNGNYNAALDVIQGFTVAKALLTVTVQNATKVYGGSLPAFSAVISGYVYGDTASVVSGAAAVSTTATVASPVGVYPITATAGTLTATNYTFTNFVNGSLTITPAVLTVTASGGTRQYGASNSLSYGISGLLLSDTLSVVSGTPNLSTLATPLSSPGVYQVTAAQGSLTATNYTFTFQNGPLTVTQATSDVAITGLTPGNTALVGTTFTFSYLVQGVVGAAAPSGNLIYSVDGGAKQNAAVTNGTATATFAGLAVGTHTILVNYGGDTNYLATVAKPTTLTVTALPPPPPVVNTGGIVGAAGFVITVSPGGLGTIFGTSLAAATVSASAIPLPTTLGGVQVLINGVAVPLNYVSATQINFQVPFNTPTGTPVPVVVVRDGTNSLSSTFTFSVAAPSIFTYQRTPTSTDPVIVHADNTLVTPTSPAKPAEILVIYATGPGKLNNAPASGAAAPTSPLATTVDTPVVTVGGAGASVQFSGLTPGFVGLLQINIQLPATLPNGTGTPPSLPLLVTLSGATSVPVNLWVSK